MKIFNSDYDSALVDFKTIWDLMILEKTGLHRTESNPALKNEITQQIIKGELDGETPFFEELYRRIEFFPGAIEFLRSLNAMGYKISIVTSSMSSAQKKYKTEHINKFIKNEVNEIIPARKKYLHTHTGPFMDDSVKHILQHIENNPSVKGFLINVESHLDTRGAEALEKFSNYSYVTRFDEILKSLNT